MVSKLVFFKRRIADINVNNSSYKKKVLKEILNNKSLTLMMKSRLLATATRVKPDSFKWLKSWDAGKLYKK